jgi:hypothetical protein
LFLQAADFLAIETVPCLAEVSIVSYCIARPSTTFEYALHKGKMHPECVGSNG